MKNEVIDKLIEIEDRAKLLNESVAERQKNNPVAIHKKCSEIESTIEAKYKVLFDIESEKIKKESLDKITFIESEKSIKMGKLNTDFEKNHQSWEDDIFNTIIRW